MGAGGTWSVASPKSGLPLSQMIGHDSPVMQNSKSSHGWQQGSNSCHGPNSSMYTGRLPRRKPSGTSGGGGKVGLPGKPAVAQYAS